MCVYIYIYIYIINLRGTTVLVLWVCYLVLFNLGRNTTVRPPFYLSTSFSNPNNAQCNTITIYSNTTQILHLQPCGSYFTSVR